jgi:hypothetical protein
MTYNIDMKTSHPNKLQINVNGLDVVHMEGLSSNTFKSKDLSFALRICATWLDSTKDVFVNAITTYWDGDSHCWAVKVVYDVAYAPSEEK